MRIRQIALVAEHLEPAVDDLCAVLGLEVCFNDPGVAEFGLRNALLPVGNTFLEVVSPVTPEASAARLLARRRGDGGYMVIVQSEDLEADRKRVTDLGVRIVWEIAFDDIATLHLHPRDIGGAILSLDVPVPAHSWRWAGPDWSAKRRTDTTLQITGAEIQALDPAAMARRWGRVLESPVLDDESESFEVPLEAGSIRFAPIRDARGEGLAGVELAVEDPDGVLANARARDLPTAKRGDLRQVSLCGMRFSLR